MKGNNEGVLEGKEIKKGGEENVQGGRKGGEEMGGTDGTQKSDQ